jgi:peptide/nickel transport system substrate-binding protein/microcin C transport system substrate-binding protein
MPFVRRLLRNQKNMSIFPTFSLLGDRLTRAALRWFGRLVFLCVGCGAALAAPVPTGTWEHALSAYQPPKYAKDFRHFEYVNPDAPKGGLLRLGNPDRRTSIDKLNPYTIKGVAPAGLAMFMFEHLGTFSMDEPQAMYGLLAESMLVAPDLSSISFRIHPLARFNNGDPVTPEDVADSFKRLNGKLVLPSIVTSLAGVSGVVVVDARTVRFDLKDRSLDSVYSVGAMPVFSRKWGGGKPLAEVVEEQPITSGPYAIADLQMPSRIEFKRNPNYWARDLPVRRGHFNFDRIAYRMYKDLDVKREAFKAGEFDITREMSARSYARVHKGPKWDDGRIGKKAWQVETGSMLQAIDFNLRKPKFQDIRVREAIMHAWDFEAYNRLGTFSRANSIFNNTAFAASGEPSADELKLLEPFRAQLPTTVFGPAFRAPRNDTHPNALRDNLKHAAQLLAQAGWTVADDGVLRNAQGEAFTMEYLEPQQVGRNPEFERNLKKLGIQYTERLVDFSLYRRRLESFDYDVVIIVEGKFTLPNPGDLRTLYGSANADVPGGNNYRGVKSPAVDALIERIGAASTMDELLTASHALDRVIMWNHWQIPQLFTKTEPTSYWNKFGIPKVQARYFQIDSIPDEHSLPWPLWTWWDRSLDAKSATP